MMGQILALVVLGVSLLVCLSWWLGPAMPFHRLIQTVIPGAVTMKYATAKTFALLSWRAWILQRARHHWRWLSYVTMSVAFYAVGYVSFSFLQVAWPELLAAAYLPTADTATQSVAPGVPSVGTGLAFFCCGLAPLAGAWWSKLFGFVLAGCAYAISLVAMLGYALGAPLLYWYLPGSSTAMAVNTAGLMALLAIATWCVVHRGVVPPPDQHGTTNYL